MTGRRRLLWLLVLASVAVAGWIVYSRWAWFVNRFETERADAAALGELASASLGTAPPAAADWPQWRGPNRDGRAAGPINADWTAKPPKVIWSAPGGGGYASLAVAGGRVYAFDYDAATKSERLRCLDAATGAVRWTTAEPADYSSLKAGYAGGPRATPTVHDGRVYTVGAGGRFRCLRLPAGDGDPQPLWEHDLAGEFRAGVPSWGFASSPLVEGELVIVQPGGRDGSVAAFDRITGERRWAAGKNPNGYSSPVAATLAGVRQVVAVTGDSIVGLRPADGTVLWSHPWVTQHNANIASPVIAGDYVFVGSDYGKGCVCLRVEASGDGVRAKEVYFRKNRVMASHITTPVERDGYLYGFDGHAQAAELRCVNLRTGEPVDGWEAIDGTRPLKHGSLVLVGPHLLGLSEDGTLFLADADPTAFRLRGKMPGVLGGRECWAAPAVVDGRVYVWDAETVACVDVR